MNRIILILIILVFTAGVSARTSVQGTITGQTWTKSGSPYNVTGNIIVEDLVIEAGVEVLFNNNFAFEITGSFTALGNGRDSIYFKPDDDNTSGWQGLSFNSVADHLKLSYCVIEGSSENGIIVVAGVVNVNNSRITNNTKNGLLIRNSSAELEKNIFSYNQEHGINLGSNSNALIYSALIEQNISAGLYYEGNGLELYNSVIASNHAEGIKISASSDTFKCYNSTITLNQAGLFNADANVWLENSIFWSNGVSEISNFGGNVDVKYCNIKGVIPGGVNDLEGNISEPPEFVESSNFKLSSTSPCIDAGNPSLFYDSFFPPSLGTTRGDIGAYGGPEASRWYHPLFVSESSVDFGKVSYDKSEKIQLSVKNYRFYPISLNGINISGKDSVKYNITKEPAFYPYSLESKDSLEIEIEFVPGEGSGQPFAGVLILENEETPEFVNMTGIGVQANITLIPSSISFEATHVGRSQARMLKIYNTGNDSLKISDFELSDPAVFSTDQPDLVIPPSTNDTIFVSFMPDSATNFDETLTIHSNARYNQIKVINLSGLGLAPVIATDDDALDFGSVKIFSDTSAQITVRNNGNEDLIIANARVVGPDSAQFELTTLVDSLVIPVGGNPETLDLSFSPKLSGRLSAYLQIMNNDPKKDTLAIVLSGESLAPELQLDPVAVHFGEVRLYTDSLFRFAVGNAGGLNLTIDTLFLENSQQSDFSLLPAVFPLTFFPGSNPDFLELRFIPNEEGLQENRLVCISNDYRRDTTYIEISGTGVAPKLALDSLNIRFGEVRLGKDKAAVTRFINAGSAELRIDSLEITGAAKECYVLSDYELPMIISAHNGLDSVTISFNPAALGNSSAQLKIVSTDIQIRTRKINLTGFGVAPFISSDFTLYDFGRVPVGGDTILPVKIKNYGNTDLTVSKAFFQNDQVFELVDNPAPFTIPVGLDSQILEVKFNPDQYTRSNDKLILVSDAYNTDSLSLDVTGIGYLPGVPLISLKNNTPADFGEVVITGDSSISLIIENLSEDAVLVVDSLSVEGSDAPYFAAELNSRPFAVQPGQESLVGQIRFNPVESRHYSSVLKVFSNDTLNSPLAVVLNGKGITDRTRPQFAVNTSVNQLSLNQAGAFQIEIEDAESAIQSANLYLRPAGKQNFQPIEMTHIENLTWTGPIADSLVTERGLEYYVSANHGGIVSTYPESGSVAPEVINIKVPEYEIPFETKKNEYQQISIPFHSGGQSLQDLFGDELGKYDSTKYRIFDWNESQAKFIEQADLTASLPAGKSLYLITKVPQKLTVEHCTTALESGGFELSLKQGWNMIAAPYAFPALWQDILPGADGEALLHWQGKGWEYAQELEPFKGYGYWSEADTVLIIPAKEANIGSRKETVSGLRKGEWRIRIEARCGEYEDLYNFAGVKLSANDGFDRTDRIEPPVLGQGISLYFKPSSESETRKMLASDYRSTENDILFYDFEFNCNFSGKTLLNCVANDLPDSYDWMIVSKDGEVVLPKGEISSSLKSKSYQLIVGDRTSLDQIEMEFKPVPKSFRVSQNYPNPFNPVTKITIELPREAYINVEIFDILGRRIKTLADRELTEEGYHQLEWDGKNAFDQNVATGIYFLNLRAPGYTKTIKMMLNR